MANVLPADVLPEDKGEGVDQLVRFITIFHGKYFLQAHLPTSAPRLDLQLWKDMLQYSLYDGRCK